MVPAVVTREHGAQRFDFAGIRDPAIADLRNNDERCRTELV